MGSTKPIVLFILLAIAGWGCSTSLSSKEGQRITFINRTTKPLVVSVFELQTHSQLDLVFSRSAIDVDTLNALEIGEDTTIAKKDIYALGKYRPVENIFVYIGIIRNDSLFYNSSKITADQLKAYEYQIKIREDTEGNVIIDK